MPRIALALLCLAVWSVAPALGIGVETIRKHPEGTDVALVFVHGLAGGPCSSFESLAFARAGEPVYQCRFYEPRPRPPAGRSR